MKKIPLTKGFFALVDDEDYEELMKHKWYVNAVGFLHYAHRQYRDSSIRNSKGKSKQVLVLMHREIINAPKGKNVDHINGNGLDNQRENLRICTQSQNLKNQRRRGVGYKGVVRTRNGKKWQVSIRANGVVHNLGNYTYEKSAAREYDKLARLLHGQFACLNFPDE